MSTAPDLLPKPSRDEPAADQSQSAAPDFLEELRNPADRRGPFRPKSLVSSRARLQGWTVARFLQAADALALAAAGAVVLLFPQNGPIALITAAVGGVGVMAALSVFKAYDFQARESLGRQAVSVSAAFAMGAACACMALLLIAPHTSPADALQVWAPLAWAAILAFHATGWFAVRRWRASGRLTPNIVVVGATGAAERLVTAMLRTREANILGVFDDRAARSPRAIQGVPVLGDTQALLDHRIMPYVDRVVISVPSRARDRVGQLIERLRVLPNEITLLLDGEDEAHEAAAIERIAHMPLARLSGPPADHGRALVKRMQDMVVGTLALVLAAPIMLGVAVAIRLDSPGPALFRQRRHGFNNEEIVVFKFRSMKVESADARATRQISAGDDRVTRVGRFIRRTSLDELPQIFNVLMGEMSLVGPRPHAIGMMTGDVESARLVAEYAHRHRMKPGMTGWAAIHGSRGPVDTPESVERRVALDVEYIDRQSFWLDLYIMAVTIPCLLGDTEAVR
jgi:Undecaprenyl-phosphate glucose phosphotransferase